MAEPDPTAPIAVTIGVILQVQKEHERRITLLESNYGRLLFWSVTATASSITAVIFLVVDLIGRIPKI